MVVYALPFFFFFLFVCLRLGFVYEDSLDSKPNFFIFSMISSSIVCDIDNASPGVISLANKCPAVYTSFLSEVFLYFVVSVIYSPFTHL